MPMQPVARQVRLMQQLWDGKKVALVCESKETSIYRLVKLTARKIEHIPCPHRETYAVIEDIQKSVVRSKPDIAILSAGPAATCLANRLAYEGVQAVDIGSAGGFLLMLVTCTQ